MNTEPDVHPDLDLLASLSRELQSDMSEAMQAGVNIPDLLSKGGSLLGGLGVDGDSICAFIEWKVEKLMLIVSMIHGGGRPRPNPIEIGVTQGLVLEAFITGIKFAEEKHEWAKAKTAGQGQP